MPHHLLPKDLDSSQQQVASEALATLSSFNYFHHLANQMFAEYYNAVDLSMTDSDLAQKMRAGSAIKAFLLQMQAEASQLGDNNDSATHQEL